MLALTITSVDLATEEDVKVKFLIPWLSELGYDTDHCEFNKAIEVTEGRRRKKIFADVVVYTSSDKVVPLVCCETKGPNQVLGRAEAEQAISYSRLLPTVAPFALLTNGKQIQVFQALDKNRVKSLPDKGQLTSQLTNLVVSDARLKELRQEAKHELFIIDDVQTFKRLLKSCHDEIRNNEGYDPAAAFDELSKVLFCKMHEEKRSGPNRFTLSVFDDTLANLAVNIVQKIFDETSGDSRFLGLFKANERIALQDRTLRRMVELFEATDLSLTAFDVKGEAFEYFLGDTFTGGLGQYFTPRTVVQFISDALVLKIGHKIVDPFCGTGGFLIHAFETVSDKIESQAFADEEKEKWRLALSNESLFGTDWAERTSQTCKMNMVVHGDGSAGIKKAHGLLDVPGVIEEGKFDVCLTNPPFGSYESDPKILARYELGTGAKSRDRVILAVERAIRLVKPGGQIGIVVIDGILNNASLKYVRDYIRRHALIRAVVSLAPETFEGYGGRSDTSVLLLEKRAEPSDDKQSTAFMAVARNTGYAPNGDPIAGNELPDILLDYKSYVDGAEDGNTPEFKGGWVAELKDRLDPGYYFRQSLSGDVSEASIGVEALRADLDIISDTVSTIRAGLSESVLDFQPNIRVIGDMLEEVKSGVSVEENEKYDLLGVRWWGEGTFVRETKPGSDIRGRLFKVSPGQLMYNRLFAYRGSFAIVPDAHSGSFVSNEFPIYMAKGDAAESEFLMAYLVHFLNAPSTLAFIDARSTGSTRTSRNRFMQAEFEAMRIPVPSASALPDVVGLLDSSLRARVSLKEALERARLSHSAVATLLPAPEL